MFNNTNYSTICDHSRVQRINSDFIRCLKCGQSMIDQVKISSSKTQQDFVNENKSFDRNFERNFTNVVEEIDEQKAPPLEFYIDQYGTNYAIIDKTIQYDTYPPKYKINLNGKIAVMNSEKINKVLSDIRAIRIDEAQFKTYFNNRKF